MVLGRVEAYIVVHRVVMGQCRVTKARRRASVDDTGTNACIHTCGCILGCDVDGRDCLTYTTLLGSSSRRSGTSSHFHSGPAIRGRVLSPHCLDTLVVVGTHLHLHILCLADWVQHSDVVDLHFVHRRSLAEAADMRTPVLEYQT
jgi:hypothetical protein